MLSNFEVEIPGAIDPNLNCKPADEVRQWAVRRTRSSFSGGKKKRLVTQTVDEEPRRTEETPISNSAKISANTLGQHFNDSIEIVPIKKRRFLFVQSPSPMQSSYSDDYDTLLERQLAAYHEPSAYDKDLDRKFIANKRTSLNHVIEEVNDAADFSGISMLAAAACNSEMVGDGIDSSSLVPKGNSYENVLRENPNDEDKERQLQCYEDLCENNANMETCSAFNSSQNNKSSMGSLQNISDKIRSSSLSRLHWDLNIGMDAWNSNCDDLVPEPPVVTDIGGTSSKPNEKLADNDTCQCRVENDKSTCPPELDESFANVDGIAGDKHIAVESLAKPEIGNIFFVSNHEKEASFPNGHSLIKEEHHLDSTAASLVNYTGKTKLAHYLGNNTCNDEVVSSTTGDVLGISFDGSLAIESINKAKTKMNSGLEVKTETTLCSENVIGDFNADAYKSHLNCLQSLSKSICHENANIIVSSTESSSADHFSTNAEEQPAPLCSSKIEKHGVLNPDAVSGDRSLLDDDICRNLVTVSDMSGKTMHCDGRLDITNHTDKSSGEVCRSPSLLNAHQCNSPSQCNPDELTSVVTRAAKHENTTEDLKVEDDYAVGLKASISVASVTAVAKTDVNLVTEAVGTQGAGKSNMDSCDQNLVTSQVDLVQDTELEKVDLQGDDDSQFEDGEFRESVLHSWEEDGGDEVESEHVDYGSDNEENDIIEAVSAIAASDSFTIENMVFKEKYLVDADEAHSGKDRQVTLSQPSSKHSSKSDGPDGGQQKRTTEDVVTDHANQSALNLRRKKRNVIGFHSEGDNNREPLADVRTKSSGWDQLPEGRRHTAHFLLDRGIGSVKQDDAPDSLRVFGDGESLRRSGLTFRVGLSSRVDGLKSSDNKPYRKDKFYTRLSRYNGHDGLEAKAEKNIGAPNSVGWGRSSRHTQKRGRDEHWSDSSNCRGPTHHVSPGYYDNKNYAQPTSRNAAAAAVAKVESNGFVVAPDGTLVKASGAGSAGRVPKRSANAFPQTAHPSLSRWGVQTDRDHPFRVQRRLQNSRELSPDRQFGFGMGQDGKYAHDMDSSQCGRRIPCDRTESPLATHRLSRRNRSFSPSRRPLRVTHSHTASPSRSRTRSPLPRTSPRGRNDFGMNDVPVFHRRNRSPVTRMERERSPSSEPCFDDRMMVCGSASGNLASPSHASRCIDDRKDASNHLREHRYKRYFKRSPPAEVFSSRRFDSVDSQGRPNPDDYHSLQSRRKTEFENYDGNNDRRGHGGKYELLHSVRQYDCTNNEKRSTRF